MSLPVILPTEKTTQFFIEKSKMQTPLKSGCSEKNKSFFFSFQTQRLQEMQNCPPNCPHRQTAYYQTGKTTTIRKRFENNEKKTTLGFMGSNSEPPENPPTITTLYSIDWFKGAGKCPHPWCREAPARRTADVMFRSRGLLHNIAGIFIGHNWLIHQISAMLHPPKLPT